jgi:glycosyltransferase involved in cell wall biosynthesis
MEQMDKILYIVIPCYNEEESLPETANRLKDVILDLIHNSLISDKSGILFVDDGSSDNTWSIIKQLHSTSDKLVITGIKLSRNTGHQNALLAGLIATKDKADIIISMDADLQDDIAAIKGMVEQYYKGDDIVYGVRKNRKKDTFFKRISAHVYYKFMHFLGADLIYNHADYRLMSKRSLDSLTKFGEVNLFLRGLVPMLGYAQSVIYYERGKRFGGVTKYPLKKMVNFALDGITSISMKPIRYITLFGFFIFLISALLFVFFIVAYFLGLTEPGWPSLIISIWVIGGLQMLSIGIVGEYVGKTYLETKARPRFIIEETLEDTKELSVTDEQ